MTGRILIESPAQGLPAVPGVRYRYEAGRQSNRFENANSRLLPPYLWSPECKLQCLNCLDYDIQNHLLADWFRNVTTTMDPDTIASRKGLPHERTASETMRSYFMTKARLMGVEIVNAGEYVSVYESPTTADDTFRTGVLVGDGRFRYDIDPANLSRNHYNAFHLKTSKQLLSNVPGLRPISVPFVAMPVSIDAMDCVAPPRPGKLREIFSEATQAVLRYTLLTHDMNSSLPKATGQAVQHILCAQRALDSIPHAEGQNLHYPSPDAIVATLALATLVQPSLHKIPEDSVLDGLMLGSQIEMKGSAGNGQSGKIPRIFSSIFLRASLNHL